MDVGSTSHASSGSTNVQQDSGVQLASFNFPTQAQPRLEAITIPMELRESHLSCWNKACCLETRVWVVQNDIVNTSDAIKINGKHYVQGTCFNTYPKTSILLTSALCIAATIVYLGIMRPDLLNKN